MKTLYTLLLVLIPLFAFTQSQINNKPDSSVVKVSIPMTQLDSIVKSLIVIEKEIQRMEELLVLKESVIAVKNNQINLYTEMLSNETVMRSSCERGLIDLQQTLDKTKTKLKREKNNRWLWGGLGAALVTGIVIIAK